MEITGGGGDSAVHEAASQQARSMRPSVPLLTFAVVHSLTPDRDRIVARTRIGGAFRYSLNFAPFSAVSVELSTPSFSTTRSP